ncbi:hypothetical protein RDABS01_014534, partial [Bienertia sinuspersici]
FQGRRDSGLDDPKMANQGTNRGGESRNAFIFFCYSGEDRDKLAALSTVFYKGALIVFKKWIPSSSLMDHDFSWGTIWKDKDRWPTKGLKGKNEKTTKRALILGCFLELEEGRTKWVRFRYESIFLFCMNCGRIGHKDGHCKKSPKKAKEDIIRVMNKMCIEENDQIINDDSILPIYSNKILGLKGTPGTKTTSINLLLLTDTFEPENLSESSDSEEEDKDEEEESEQEEEHETEPDNLNDKGGGPNGDPGPSRKRPSSSSDANSSDPPNELGRPSRRRRMEFHERMLKQEVDSPPHSRKRKSLKEEGNNQVNKKRRRKTNTSNSRSPTTGLDSRSLIRRCNPMVEEKWARNQSLLVLDQKQFCGSNSWAGFEEVENNGSTCGYQLLLNPSSSASDETRRLLEDELHYHVVKKRPKSAIKKERAKRERVLSKTRNLELKSRNSVQENRNKNFVEKRKILSANQTKENKPMKFLRVVKEKLQGWKTGSTPSKSFKIKIRSDEMLMSSDSSEIAISCEPVKGSAGLEQPLGA